MRFVDADAHECWACIHTQNAKGLCDTWCDSGEAFEIRPIMKEKDYVGGPKIVDPISALGGSYCRLCCFGNSYGEMGVYCKRSKSWVKPEDFCSKGKW